MDIFTALADLNARHVQQAGAKSLRDDWSGIGFRIGTQRFLAPQSQVAEVLSPPRITLVPNAPPWLRGLANLRGTVVPLYDLGHCLLDTRTPAHSRNRYLVLADASNPVGFLVDAVSGLRRFARADMRAVDVRSDSGLLMAEMAPYVSGAFPDGNDVRLVFSLRKVVQERLNAGAAVTTEGAST
ncbi:MAG: chemotaxis protein CheW [Oceanococcaceae bacterium]